MCEQRTFGGGGVEFAELVCGKAIDGLPASQSKSRGFRTHSPLAVHIAVISGPESHLKVASDPSITLVKSTNPLLGLGGTPQVAERTYSILMLTYYCTQ